MTRFSRMALAALAGLSPISAQAAEQAALAVIDVVSSSDGIQIIGKAVAISDAQLSGEMTITRIGASGSVSTRQASDLDMRAGQSANIAQVGVSFAGGDQLDVKVVLKQHGRTISEAVLRTGGE